MPINQQKVDSVIASLQTDNELLLVELWILIERAAMKAGVDPLTNEEQLAVLSQLAGGSRYAVTIDRGQMTRSPV